MNVPGDYKRVKFVVEGTEYDLGVTEWVNVDYTGNVQTRVIPRARGVKIWNTSEIGGGLLTVTVDTFIVMKSRLEVEQYVVELINKLANKKGDLVIEGVFTISDCYIREIRSEKSESRWNRISITFAKSL